MSENDPCTEEVVVARPVDEIKRLNAPEEIKRIQELIGADKDGMWGKQTSAYYQRFLENPDTTDAQKAEMAAAVSALNARLEPQGGSIDDLYQENLEIETQEVPCDETPPNLLQEVIDEEPGLAVASPETPGMIATFPERPQLALASPEEQIGVALAPDSPAYQPQEPAQMPGCHILKIHQEIEEILPKIPASEAYPEGLSVAAFVQLMGQEGSLDSLVEQFKRLAESNPVFEDIYHAIEQYSLEEGSTLEGLVEGVRSLIDNGGRLNELTSEVGRAAPLPQAVVTDDVAAQVFEGTGFDFQDASLEIQAFVKDALGHCPGIARCGNTVFGDQLPEKTQPALEQAATLASDLRFS